MSNKQLKIGRATLKGESALNLWHLGRDEWNRWVEANPTADIDFSGVDFSKEHSIELEEIDFTQFNFPTEGRVDFSEANFGDRNVVFIGAVFGDVSFYRTYFGKGEILFDGSVFAGEARFTYISYTNKTGDFSFKGSRFLKLLDFSGSYFSCVIDLTCTSINHHVSLDNFTIEAPSVPYKNPLQEVRGELAVAKLRRLKEIAENNRDHKHYLDFHANEMRIARSLNGISRRDFFWDYMYDKCSNYGRCEIRPFLGVILIWAIFGIFYYSMSSNELLNISRKALAAMSFSASQVIPIVPGSGLAQSQSMQLLFFGKMELGVYVMSIIQNVLSIIFFFLIGLALRNRFRV